MSDTPAAQDELAELLEHSERDAGQIRRRKLCWRISVFLLLAVLIGAATVLVAVNPVVEYRNKHNLNLGGAKIYKWLYLAAAMVASGILARLLVRILVSLVSRQLLLTPSLLYILRPLKGSMALTLHAGFCALLWWAMFGLHIDNFDEDVYQAGKRISLSLFCLSVARLAKGLLAKVAAMRFHREAYFTSMQKALVKEFYLQALSTLPNTPIEKAEKLFSSYLPFLSGRSAEEDGSSDGSGGTSQRRDPHKVAKLESYIRSHKLKDTFARDLVDGSEGAHPLSDQAKVMTEHLWMNIQSLKQFPSRFVTRGDILPFLPEKLAGEAFELFDVNGDGQVSKEELEKNVLLVFQERANLQKSLKDADSVVGKLEQCIAILTYLVAGCISLVIFRVDVLALFVTSSSIIVAGSFIFGSSLRQLFESFLFILSVHPFDVGDMLLVDNQPHRVLSVQLLSTVLHRWNGQRVYYPNSALMAAPLVNLSHSANRMEGCSLLVDHDTPMHKISMLREACAAFLAATPQHFDPADRGTLRLSESDQPLKVKLTAYFTIGNNGSDIGKTSNARDYFIDWFRLKVAEMHITYHLPPVAEGVPVPGANHTPAMPTSVRDVQLEALEALRVE